MKRTRRHIIAIVGGSGSGKTFASQLLVGPGCKTIVSYTTRPMRAGEVDGIDHWFVNEDRMPPKEKMCAYTFFGGYHYWTEWNQFGGDKDLVDNYFAYVIDEKGLINLWDKPQSHQYDIIAIKIIRPNRDDISQERIDRDAERITIKDIAYDYIVINDGTLEDFQKKINNIFQRIKSIDYGSTKK